MREAVSLLPKGTTMVRVLRALCVTPDLIAAREFATQKWGPESPPALILKAAANAGGVDWGDPLTAEAGREAFSLVRQASIVGKMPGLREIPFHVRAIGVMSGATARWVGRGAPKPLSKMALDGAKLAPFTLAAMLGEADELVTFAGPLGEQVIRDDLVRALAELWDQTFIDPAAVGVPDESPASVTSDAASIASTGDPGADLTGLVEVFEGDLGSAVVVSDPVTFSQLPLWRDPGGALQFVDVGPRGGNLLGVPAIASRSSPRDSSGGNIALVDPTGIAFAQDGVRVDKAQHATVEFSDDPDNPTTENTVMVNAWQSNLILVRAELLVNWRVVRPGSVAVVTGVDYSGAGS